MKIKNLTAALLGSAAVAFQVAPAMASESWSFHYDHVLGTSLDIIAVATNEKFAQAAADAASSTIQRLESLLSGWRDDSELSALNRASEFSASTDLFQVIAACERWRAETGGAFSARLGGVLDVIRKEAAAAANDLGSMAAAINSAVVTLDDVHETILRPNTVRFAVDGLAKGYIVDRALEAARSVLGVQGVMIDIGGDLRCWGHPPSSSCWRVGVVDPDNAVDNGASAMVLALNDKAVATSGRGSRGNMTIEPQTGLPAQNVVMATAVANSAADADALASAFSVLAPWDSVALADRLPDVAAHIVSADGRIFTSAGWQALVAIGAKTSLQLAAADTRPVAGALPWPAGFTLKVDYEVPAAISAGRRVHNPYVTAWISNETGDLVRVLMYLAGKRRYQDENYIFWQRVGASRPDLVEAVTRPTRPPGRYTLMWDGRDDQGRAVPQGKYVLNVEAAREHGGHSIQHLNLMLGATPLSTQAPGQEEIGPTQVSYGNTL
jgi:thiamine biosynthesis lipoprotein